ncbi:tetratricopeptide repeat protein [Paludisphaera soli]|uniref:tetratricopeptide repeat protein n=1 Tax=Paludisphaera soli TaxID=2712865 RepID=UPI0013EE0C11|nr:tetratricopeptide repeat protein [Paludisphaera soli]
MGQVKPDLAEEQFREILRLDPANATAHCGLATAILAQPPISRPRIDEMVASLKESIRLKVDPRMSYSIVGQVFSAAGRPDEGTKLLEDAVAAEGAPGIIHYHLAEALQARIGRDAEAVSHYQTAIAGNLPRQLALTAHARLGALHEAQGRPGDALAEYRKASTLAAPGGPEARSAIQAIRRLEGAGDSPRRDGAAQDEGRPASP